MRALRLSVREWSLRTKVVALLLTTSVLPTALVALVVLDRDRDQARSANVALLQARVDQVADTLEAHLRGFRAAALRSARDPEMIGYCVARPAGRERAQAAVTAHLVALHGLDPAIRGLGVVDLGGTVVAASEPERVGEDLSRRDYFRRASAGQSATSEIYLPEDGDPGQATLAIAEPVWSASGAVVGVLAVWVRAGALWDVMNAANGTAGEGSYFILFDRYGIRVGHSRSGRLLFHPAGPLSAGDAAALLGDRRFGGRTSELLAAVVPYPLEAPRSGGRAVYRRPRSPSNAVDNLAVARHLDSNAWTLVAHVPEAAVAVPIGSVLPRLLPSIIGTLVAALGAFSLLRSIVIPVTALSAAVEAVERGELDSARARPAVHPGAAAEVKRLATAFRSMARTIADRDRGLRASNRDLRLVLDSVGQGFLSMDAAGAISPERSSVVDLWLGPPRDGQPIWSYLGGDDAALTAQLREGWRAALAGAGDPEALARLPARMRRGALTLDLRFRAVAPEGLFERVGLVVTDVTDDQARLRREAEMEAELRQAQKLEAVGRLASGIAHEINTPLQYVGDSCAYLFDAVGALAPLVERYRATLADAGASGAAPSLATLTGVAEAEAAADVDFTLAQAPKAAARALDGLMRVTDIVRAMKEFAHPDQREMTAVDLNRAVQSTLTIARNEYKYVADVVTDLGDLPAVTCHPGEINQAVLNILINAAHAIGDVVQGSGEKGLITVRTRREGDQVVVSIGDTGPGIPAAIRDHVYDLFFTTKEVGRGTGQGLWISRSVVCDKHRGSLTFETEVGVGTTFHLRLPVDGPPGAAAAVAGPFAGAHHGP